MQFVQKGNSEGPRLVLIHAMYTDGTVFDALSERLCADYRLIIPTLDGHGTDGTVFHSVGEEADGLIDYLDENGLWPIELVYGISLGGIIAFEVCRRRAKDIGHGLFDGAPFVHMPPLRRKFMAVMFRHVAHAARRRPGKKGILDREFPGEAGLMKRVCGRISDESIDNLAQACYTYILPEALEPGMKVTFLYGSEERAAVCVPEVKKLSGAKVLVREGCGHCQFLSSEPDNYAKLISEIAKEERQ